MPRVSEGAWPLGFFCFAELVSRGLGCEFSIRSVSSLQVRFLI